MTVNTIHHGFWTYFIFRKQKRLVKYFVIGSILPDIIYYVMFIYLSITSGVLFSMHSISEFPIPFFHLVHEMFANSIVVVLRQAGHSLFVWAVLFSIAFIISKWRLTKWKAFLYGWLGHVIVDSLTHVNDAVPIFYPVSNFVLRGPVSYWDPQFYGHEFNIVHTVFLVGAIVYLIYERKTYKNKRKFDKC
jgi:hypothetical protein